MNIHKFKKRPVVIEAVRLSEDNLEQVEKWCKGSIKGIKLPRYQQVIDIQTLEGEMRATIGDWIIRGIKGEFYPCKNEIFMDCYEEVS
jgi:hypothetical protein